MNSFAAALFLLTRTTLNRTVFDSGLHCPKRKLSESSLMLLLWGATYRRWPDHQLQHGRRGRHEQLGSYDASRNGLLILKGEWSQFGPPRERGILLRTVFWNEMEIISSDDDCSVHFGGDDTSSKDTTTDRNLASERALLVWWRGSVLAKSAFLWIYWPIYVPFIASCGVLYPRPMSLYHRLSRVTTFFPPAFQITYQHSWKRYNRY